MMNLVLVLLLTTVIEISSNPLDRRSRQLTSNRTLNMPSQEKHPENYFSARYYVGNQIVNLLEVALGYVQSGLNLLIGRGSSDESIGRSGKSRIKYKGYQVLRVDAQNQVKLKAF